MNEAWSTLMAFLSIMMQIMKAAGIFIKNFLSIIFFYRMNVNEKRDNNNLRLAAYMITILLLVKGII